MNNRINNYIIKIQQKIFRGNPVLQSFSKNNNAKNNGSVSIMLDAVTKSRDLVLLFSNLLQVPGLKFKWSCWLWVYSNTVKQINKYHYINHYSSTTNVMMSKHTSHLHVHIKHLRTFSAFHWNTIIIVKRKLVLCFSVNFYDWFQRRFNPFAFPTFHRKT